MFLKRKIYLEKIKKELDNYKILFLVGARQVGKTSLLKSLIDFSYIKEEETLFLYGDKLSFMGIKDFMALENFIFSKIDKKKLKTLIIDEAQYIENIGLILKIFYDTFKREESNIKIIASGSGSLEVFRGITDSLIGRKKIVNIYPLSFLEFLEFKKFNTEQISYDNISEWQIKELLLYLDEFLTYGSYPEVVFTKNEKEKLEILNGIYNDYIYKDIGFYLKTDEIISFDKFLKYIGYGVCSTVKIDKIVKEIGISRRLVEKFIFLVENTFILNFIPAFTKNKQKEVSKHKKVYFTDLGFLRKILGINNIGFENKGKFIENFVFLELLKYKDNLDIIYYYQKKNGSEIDFIIENEFTGKIKPIEIKSGSNDNIPIIFKSFILEYEDIIDKFYLMNKDIIKKRVLNEKEVFILSYLFLFKEF